MAESQIKSKGQKIASGCHHLLQNGTPTIIAGHVEIRRKEMMFVLPQKRKTVIFASNILQTKGRN